MSTYNLADLAHFDMSGHRHTDWSEGMPEADAAALFLTAVNTLSTEFRVMSKEFGAMTEQLKNLAEDQHSAKDHGEQIKELQTEMRLLKEKLIENELREERWKARNSQQTIGILGLIFAALLGVAGLFFKK
jgi:hypothetical protein